MTLNADDSARCNPDPQNIDWCRNSIPAVGVGCVHEPSPFAPFSGYAEAATGTADPSIGANEDRFDYGAGRKPTPTPHTQPTRTTAFLQRRDNQ